MKGYYTANWRNHNSRSSEGITLHFGYPKRSMEYIIWLMLRLMPFFDLVNLLKKIQVSKLIKGKNITVQIKKNTNQVLWPRRGLSWRNGRCSRPGCWTNRWTGMTPGSCWAAAWGAAWGAEGAGAGIYAGTESWDDTDAREPLTELRRRRAAGRASSSALKKKINPSNIFSFIYLQKVL